MTFLQLALVALNLTVRIYSSIYMIISDCDETFNYWEPLNLLLRGFGKQTWEYSPEYAIRSYTYLVPYYLVAYPVGKLVMTLQTLHTPAYYQFYFLRLLALNAFTCFAEIKLYRSVSRNISSKVGCWFLFFTSIAPGMAHAGVALLPSSFAMQCNMMALTNVLSAVTQTNNSVSTSKYYSCHSIFAIIWYLIGGIVGWPFALALGVTFGLYTLASGRQLISIIRGCILGLVTILVTIVGIDSYFYNKVLLVPLNIVFYNVFGGEGEGPEIFGVEPFSYYVLNLLVNFNIVAVLGYIGIIVNPFLYKMAPAANISLPLLIWSGIFFLQPHKEERFLYPIYPLITLSAALFVSKIFALVSQISIKVIPNHKIANVASRGGKILFGALVFAVSILRILNLVENYSAPLVTLENISQLPASDRIVNVCVGKEWYHIPNSLFLPDNYRFRFVKSGFDGLLPGDFLENGELRQATSSIPTNMNNKNAFESDKVIDFLECDYYIDNSEVSRNNEPRVIERVDGIATVIDPEWKLLGCNKIIDPNGQSNGIGRLLYVPKALRSVIPYKVEYLDFCAMERKSGGA